MFNDRSKLPGPEGTWSAFWASTRLRLDFALGLYAFGPVETCIALFLYLTVFLLVLYGGYKQLSKALDLAYTAGGAWW